jgi:ribosomal protein L11 methyltransferase
VTRENLRRNHIAAGRCHIIAGSLIAAVRGRFHVVAANLLSETICVLLADIGRVLRPGGIFIGAGITAANRPRVVQRMRQVGLKLCDSLLTQDWVTVAGRWKK